MNNKKIFGTFLAVLLCVSSTAGGWVSTIVNPSAVFAADESDCGVFSAPLIQYKSSKITTQLTNTPLHYSSSAVFTVSETGKQSLTFFVDNWSLYDAFIPMKQQYVTNYKSSATIIPNSIFNEENREYFGAYDSIASKYVSDAYNDYYKYGESSNKFGDFVVEQYDEVTDRAYITVDIDDYSEKFMFLAILNTPNNSANTSYYSLVTFGLNTLDVSDVSDMQDANNSRWTYKTEIPTKVEKYSEQAIYSSTVAVLYTNNANNYNAQNVFDYGEVMHNDNGTYTAKYHISDYVSYNDFKTLSSVNYREELASYNWVDCATGTFTNLESKDGYISIEYNSLLDLQLGSLIYFDVEDDGDDNYFYFCSPTWDLADIQTIKFGDMERTYDIDAMNRALQISCADEFVSQLENGIDTLLGERGTGLSEGQMQRIAVARAIFSDSPVLLLDEATSSLDENTEKHLLENLQTMTDKTVIIITHRPKALELCDKVIQFENGGINDR